MAMTPNLSNRNAATAPFISQTFGREIDDPLGYDMILNLGELQEEAAVCAVEAALSFTSSDQSLLNWTG